MLPVPHYVVVPFHVTNASLFIVEGRYLIEIYFNSAHVLVNYANLELLLV